MNDNDNLRDVVRSDMRQFAERQRHNREQVDRYKIIKTYADRFDHIAFHDIETVVLDEAGRAGVHL
ncbi:hypothetical protein [Pelagibacterium luteolum]|uniref:Uncharacterized protein n=1 Tax=Pelagibacterium luteolum TaxID=440168 RepID=A0A1G7UZI9_9HYPH|nr:hypothetical protein [Pelagibacterium luteolum]SDG52130.1 hypothetical protein SAMN04487974_103335 [Pelagibacterium luteolum]